MGEKNTDMSREEMLEKLKAIAEPLVSLTGFCDGVTCEYLSSHGCGGFELLDWSDLDAYDYDSPDQMYDAMSDDELKECINRLASGDFKPKNSQACD